MTFLHATWTLLNLVLIIVAYVIAYRSYRLFSERFGCLPSGLLILAIAGTCSSGARNKAVQQPVTSVHIKNIYPANTWPFTNRNVVVYGDDLFWLTQSISVTPVQNSDSLRLQSTIVASGLTLGTRWEPVQTVVGLVSGRRAFYQSTGNLTWYLLGVPVYIQMKHFEGEVDL